MHYVMIQGPSYGNLDFEAREQIREKLGESLESKGIRFVQYGVGSRGPVLPSCGAVREGGRRAVLDRCAEVNGVYGPCYESSAGRRNGEDYKERDQDRSETGPK